MEQLSLALSEDAGAAALDERRRASWLLSSYSDDVWLVADSDDHSKTDRINFRYLMPDGRTLADHERLYATVKEYAWWIRDPRYSTIDDSQTHATMVRGLMHVAHGLVLRQIHSFAHLEPYDIEQLVEDARFGAEGLTRATQRIDDFFDRRHADGKGGGSVRSIDVYAQCNLPRGLAMSPRVRQAIAYRLTGAGAGERASDKLEERSITVQALQRLLDPIESLYVMRRRLEADSIRFKPFPFGAARVAAVKGAGTERTPTPPPNLALHLMEQAAIWITTDPDRALIEAASREAVIRMMTACWIIIATFSARRDGEIDELLDIALKGNLRTGWYLDFDIEKTYRRREPIPVPPLVEIAFNVLMRISAPARQLTGDRKILVRLDDGGVPRVFDVARHLDDFAKHVGVPTYKNRDGLPGVWHWSPHQFRRFFAVLYFYKYEGASIEVLNHQLRHFSLEMTRIYVTQDPEGRSMWTDVEWGYNAYVARAIVAGERSYAGAAGTSLKRAAQRIIDTLRRNLRIVTPERAGAYLASMMQKTGLVITPKSWVDCTCPRTTAAGSKAACRRTSGSGPGAVGPDYAFAGPTVCSGCPHAAMGRHKQEATDAEAVHLRAVEETQPRRSTLFGELEAARVISLEEVRKTRYARAEPVARPATGREELK